MDEEERLNVITDVTKWKRELESNDPLSREELSDYVEMLDSMNDEDLEKHWNSTVGEWILSRSDVVPDEDYETWVENQFEKVKSGEKTDYGFLVQVSETRQFVKDQL